MQAEAGVTQLQAEEPKGPPEAGRGRKDPPRKPQRVPSPANTLILDFGI